MEELEDNTSAEDVKDMDTYYYKIKPKKRSLVERELETNLTERVTSPISNGNNTNTSRYGRARRLKTDSENNDAEKAICFKSPQKDRTPIKSPVYKMHASNSPIRLESPSTMVQNTLDNQIENIYNENVSLSRFGDDKRHVSPIKQSSKVYIRKDLIQTKEKEETITLIKHYSPKESQKLNTNSSNVLQRSSEKYSINNNKQSSYLDISLSVVKTLDFDGNKKKKSKSSISKSDLFELEAKCEYQVGDLAWAKMGTYPYWPCIVTRDPYSGMFIRRKLFGRIDRDVIHVTFFGDNGRRSWIVDNMLRKFLGKSEFEAAKEKFTPETRRKDPRCAAYFVSEKKLPQWTVSVEEAETLLREPKRLRIDLLNDMLNKARTLKTTPKGSKKVSRTDSDVSLSESLYDTLFSEEDTKTNDLERCKKTRNKSLDVSEVVTACLDNMAAKTGITKIQKQSHMDRWLQKAKSKTPEKSQLKSQTNTHNPKQDRKRNKTRKTNEEPGVHKSFRITMSDNESLNELDNKLYAHENEHDYSTHSGSDYIKQSEECLIIDSETARRLETLSDKSSTNISNYSQDDEVVVSGACVINEETVVDSDSVNNELNEISDLETNDTKTVHDDNASIAHISSLMSKDSNDNNEVFMNVSETSKKNDMADNVHINESVSDINIQNLNLVPLYNSESCKTFTSNTIEEADIEINLAKDSQNISAADLQSHIAKGRDKVKDINSMLYPKHQSEKSSIKGSVVNANEDLKQNKMGQFHIRQDNVTITDDQEKQDVNIAKTIISDKLVGNIVDFNKININNDMIEISTNESFTMNFDSDLTIPEPNGHSNITNTIDDYNNVNNHADSTSSIYRDNFYEEPNILENNRIDSSQYRTCKLKNMDLALTLDNPLVCSVKNNSPDADYSDGEYIKSNKFRSKHNIVKVVTNGFSYDKDDSLETDSTINCNLYLSSSDDRSANSTPTDINEFSNLDKYKSKFVKKNHEYITLQDALVNKDVDSAKDIIDQLDNHEKFESGINVLDKSDQKSCSLHEDINELDDRSQITTTESERSSTDSNYTCDSDTKSLYSDAQTETTTTTETTESSDPMDVDESSFDCMSKHSFPGIITAQSEARTKAISQVSHCEEKAIMSGDELRLTSHGLEVINEKCMPNALDVTEAIVNKVKTENDLDTESIISTDSEISSGKRKMRWKPEKPSLQIKKTATVNMENPEFLKYLELKQDAIYDEHPELSQDEINAYLYNTWLYEESLKTETKKTDDIESANMVKGLESEAVRPSKKVRKQIKLEKEKDYELIKDEKGYQSVKNEQIVSKQKPKRRTVRPSYNEEYSDVDEDLEVFSIPKPNLNLNLMKSEVTEDDIQPSEALEIGEEEEVLDEIDEVEEYFARLTDPKPNVFKGLLREKTCDICERMSNLVKCKGCSSMFHVDCVDKETKVVEVQAPMKGRKKKKKFRGRKSKSDEIGLDESQSDEKDANISEELANTSIENAEPEPYIIANAEDFETQLTIKMKELLGEQENVCNDIFSSDDELDWSDTEVGKCEVVDIKLRKKDDDLVEYSNFKCNNCQKYDVPVCFVCRSAASPKNNALHRQRCQVLQCNKYYHLECLEHWPQTQFNSGECARYNKKINEYFEALSCPRHVCHTCVSDDPRGCKTRFSGDKLARCVRCPATYHTFTKCLPAGSQILTGSHIICPRHHEHRPGKIPCHVNTGWCFICALGGTLICCEYCPTSFHAECLNIKPPEGGYMCEDCETGRLPLYGEMVWVKLGHYRWWPGIILHPCEIPENILAVKHSPGEFVVRFFGQYDHYWVNRGRVFPFQEGDSGKVSSQKSKIDAAFTMAMEHAQRACEILKTATPNEEESLDIASSLLPPHYVKLRVNKPCGALCGRRVGEESSLTQCECSPDDEQPCGPYTHCLNRMLLTECGPTCRAGDRCHNRAFEKRLYPKLVPYRTPYRGWGLKTLEDIKAGQFVIEYVGELIDEEEFQRRMRRKHEIRDENFYFLTLDKERMIDAGPKGNLARFMNHCCEPNCETQKWTVLGDVRVGLFALYDIPANSEVTFNYNLESAGIEKKRCLCGAKRCSGYIGAKLKQTEQPKKPKRPYNKKRKIDDSPTTSKIKPKSKLGRPPKPKELTEIEKDLLIIKNATNCISSDSDCSSRLSSIESIRDLKASKRKRVGHSTEEPLSNSNSPSTKRIKLVEEKPCEICD